MSTPTLKTEQATKYQKILNAPHLKNHRFVRLENLATAQSQGKIKFRLAGIACDSLVFRAKTVEYTSEADYYWYGDIRSEEEGACFTGTMILIAKNGTLRRNILTQTYPAGEHTITIPRNNLPQGVYAIKLTTSSGYSEIKTIVINP